MGLTVTPWLRGSQRLLVDHELRTVQLAASTQPLPLAPVAPCLSLLPAHQRLCSWRQMGLVTLGAFEAVAESFTKSFHSWAALSDG